MKNNSVAIFTTFYDFDPAYSLCNCVEDQIRMFVDNGYNIKLLVDQAFKSPGGYWSHPNVTYGFLPGVHRSNEGQMNDNWKEQVEAMRSALMEELKDIKVCITHDVVLQPAHLIHNYAARLVADKLEGIRWLHWSHSPTAPRIACNVQEISDEVQKKFPRSFYCYPNDWDRKRVAINYGCELDEVKCVHHPSDFLSLLIGDETDLSAIENEEVRNNLDKKINYPIRLTKELVNQFDILNADVISVYPCRLDRGKQPEFNIKTMAQMKKMGRNVRMIIFDFHSTGGDKVTYREELKQIGRQWGLTDQELIFISEWRPDTHYNVPRQVIMNLKKLSDYHMHPSNTETYSLVVQESMAAKNFCVLNHHTPMMRDIYGSKNCLHEPFGASVNMLDGENGNTTLNISNEEQHFTNLANKILYFIENNPVLDQWKFIRQKRSLNYVFKHELEPLLYYEPLGKATFGTKPI